MRLRSPRWHRRPLLLRSRILIAVLMAGVLIVGLDSWRTWQLRDTMIAEDKIDTANLARSLAQQAHDILQVADVILVGLRERVEVDGLAPDRVARLDHVIARRVVEVPVIAGLAVFDAEGARVAGDPGAPGGTFSVGDRTYFRYHQGHADRGVHVGDPVLSRADGQWSVTVSRRVDTADGRFGGVVRARISIPLLQALYGSFDVGREGLISLVSDSGIIVASSDTDGRRIGADVSDGRVFRRIKSGEMVGSYSTISPLDGIRRLGSFRQVADYPLYVAVAHQFDEVLAGWRADARLHVAVSICMATILVVAGSIFARQVSIGQRAEHRYRLLAENSIDAIVCIGLDGSRRYVSPSFSVLTGWSFEEAATDCWANIIHADDRPCLADTVRQLIAGAAEVTSCFRYIRKDGTHLWVEAHTKLLRSLEGETQIISNVRDISARRAAEEQVAVLNRELANLANTDGLTGLANRRRFDEALAQEWRRALREEVPLTLLLLDVDRFKLYNDRYGHQSGDQCLLAVATAMAQVARRPADLTARYGGEEFVILLPGVDEAAGAALAARVLIAICATEIEHEANLPAGVVTASVGVASVLPRLDQPANSPTALLAGADAALYEAKRTGRNRVVLRSGMVPSTETELTRDVALSA